MGQIAEEIRKDIAIAKGTTGGLLDPELMEKHIVELEKDTTMMYINKLYESEINILIYSDWDAGYYAKLGDEMNGFVVESGGFDTFTQAVKYLVSQVIMRYPQSAFSKWYNSPQLEEKK